MQQVAVRWQSKTFRGKIACPARLYPVREYEQSV